jgi:hypothetical protein
MAKSNGMQNRELETGHMKNCMASGFPIRSVVSQMNLDIDGKILEVPSRCTGINTYGKVALPSR